MKKLFAVCGSAALVLVLCGCGRNEDPNAPTAAENRGLDNAAEMLDVRPDNLVPAGNTELGNGDETAEDGAQDAADDGTAGTANAQ